MRGKKGVLLLGLVSLIPQENEPDRKYGKVVANWIHR
jgi:hypothetical protein